MIFLAALLGAYAFILVVVAWVSLHPFRTPLFLSPSQFGLPQEPVEFESDGHILRGWWVPAEQPVAVAVLAHGYMMNRSELAAEAVALHKRGVSCLLFETRAHGQSGGKACTIGNHERHDLRAAILYVKNRTPKVKAVAIGSSMGSAAIALALGDDPTLLDAAVLDSCYSRLPGAILGWWRFLGGEVLKIILSPTVLIAWPMARFNPFRVDVAEALSKVAVPVLLMHGRRDSLALPAEAERNLAAIKGPKRMVWFDRSGHSQGRLEETARYHAELFQFLEECQVLTPIASGEPNETRLIR